VGTGKSVVVLSCDEGFFPLAKGLVLSLVACQLERHELRIAFIDIGCSSDSLEWLRGRGVLVLQAEPCVLGPLEDAAKGPLRAMACRPLLPRLFPEAEVFVWLDSDVWVQTPDAVVHLARLARAHPDRLFICPEWHYAYTALNKDIRANHVENWVGYYRAAYDENTAVEMSARPNLNGGVFAMAAGNPLWAMWWDELVAVYARDGGRLDAATRHLAEQMALNVVAHRSGRAVGVDPLFNYLCALGMPFRDGQDVVRVPLPPASAIHIVHLVRWNVLGRAYLERGLLYQRGSYLGIEERETLLGVG
jgi:hypothetical protein